MNNKRNMYFQDYNSGAFIDPAMQNNPGMMQQPQGYMMSGNYQAFGPNAVPNIAPNVVPNQNYTDQDYEARITKLERQIRNLDTRLSKLETGTSIEEDLTFNKTNYII